MLYPVQAVAEQRVAICRLPDSIAPPACFLLLIHNISVLFDANPTVLLLPGGSTLTLLYRNAAYLLQDVVECAAGLAAALGGACPLHFYGTTEGRETARWEIAADGSNGAVVRLYSVSGQSFDHLEGLGVQLELHPSCGWVSAMAELCASAPFLAPCAVIPRKNVELLRSSPLLAHIRGSRFSYLVWEPLPARELVFALTADHKAALWREFLADGLQPLEFDWLWALYYSGEPLFLLEWELTLRMTLEELGFRVERTHCSFRILDRSGRERRFDFAQGGPADKVFLKLLFPLDTK